MGQEKKEENTSLFGIVRIAMEAIGYGGTLTSSAYSTVTSGASFITGILKYQETSTPVYLWNAGTPIPASFVKEIGEERAKEGEKGAIFISPAPTSAENIESFKKYCITHITFDEIEKKLDIKSKEINEVRNRIENEKNELLKAGGYAKSKEYEKYIAGVDTAADNVSKKKTLENFVAFFAQDIYLKDIEVDKKTLSSEIDVYAKNERTTGIWKELGTPIIFEAKNWEDSVTSDQIRNLVLKATGSKTKFIIAWNGISGKDELKGARLEIIKAKATGVFVLVLTKQDFLKIAGGVSPEKIIEERYYNLIEDKVK
ncbi:MAG: hypothetical protein M1490_03180 [Candidatus Bathyarchaeota archaeon]|nr:hypothetical protein [Candidatus Bathyarchaeota archaeon]